MSSTASSIRLTITKPCLNRRGFFSPFFRELVSYKSAKPNGFKFFLMSLFLFEGRDECWFVRMAEAGEAHKMF
jgi:hypothetical protein